MPDLAPLRQGQQLRLQAAFMRGGTSKGLFFQGGVLPLEPGERDRVLSRALGGGDPFRKQIDGLGGATSSTSKAVVVSRSERPGIDVDYLFAQVGIEDAEVDWQGSCGNLAAAVGPFAIEEGLVEAVEGETVVRIWQVNTGRLIVAHVPTCGGHPLVNGDFQVDGLPHPGAEIRLDFMDPGGGVCGRLLPTGRVADRLQVAGLGAVAATLLDAGNPCVVVSAEDARLVGTELPEAINADPSVLERLEAIRAAGAVRMGLASSPEQASRDLRAVPKLAIVAPPASYVTTGGAAVLDADADLLVRMVSMKRLHHAIPGTGAIALAVAAGLPGSVPDSVAARAPGGGSVRLGHPGGVTTVEAEVVPDPSPGAGGWRVTRATLGRTARRLMEGWVLVPEAGR